MKVTLHLNHEYEHQEYETFLVPDADGIETGGVPSKWGMLHLTFIPTGAGQTQAQEPSPAPAPETEPVEEPEAPAPETSETSRPARRKKSED